MIAKESNKEFIIDFLKKLTSLKESDQDAAIDQIRSVFMVLGYERTVVEALPIITEYACFFNKIRLVKIVNQIMIIEFELKKPVVFDGLLQFCFELLNVDDNELRNCCIKKITQIFTLFFDQRKLQNFFWKLYADENTFRRVCIFELLVLLSENTEFLRESSFLEEFFTKLLEEPEASMKKKAIKSLLIILDKNDRVLPVSFFKSACLNLIDDKNNFISMYSILLALNSGELELIKSVFHKSNKSKVIYNLKVLFDNLHKIKKVIPTIITDEFYDNYINLFYETENDLKNLALEFLPVVVSLTQNEQLLAKIINNAKTAGGNNALKETKYNVINALLKSAEHCSKEQAVDLVLKSLLTFLREESDCVDVYFIRNLSYFVRKCGYEMLKETLDLFFRSIVIHCSQDVHLKDENRNCEIDL